MDRVAARGVRIAAGTRAVQRERVSENERERACAGVSDRARSQEARACVRYTRAHEEKRCWSVMLQCCQLRDARLDDAARQRWFYWIHSQRRRGVDERGRRHKVGQAEVEHQPAAKTATRRAVNNPRQNDERRANYGGDGAHKDEADRQLIRRHARYAPSRYDRTVLRLHVHADHKALFGLQVWCCHRLLRDRQQDAW